MIGGRFAGVAWDKGVITVQNEGSTYKATCDISRSFNNAASITEEKSVHIFSTYDLATGLVGHPVQPFEGEKRDPDGGIVVMWSVGSTLALRSWKDEHAPWSLDEFRITSVTKLRN